MWQKCSIFKTNCEKWWKVDTIHYMIMRNGRDGGISEMNYHQLHILEIQPINSNKYCFQLDQLKASYDQKKKKNPELIYRKHILFHQDNSRVHVSLMTRQKWSPSAWEVLIQPPYLPLFLWSLQNSHNGKNVSSLEYYKRYLEHYFVQKDKAFWEGGVMNCLQNGRR